MLALFGGKINDMGFAGRCDSRGNFSGNWRDNEMTDLSDLIKRLEQAGKGDLIDATIDMLKLDVSVSQALGFGVTPPRYTSSLEAALALKKRLLPDSGYDISQVGNDDCEAGILLRDKTQPLGHQWYVAVEAYHQSPAIALLIATLKALKADKKDD